MQGKVIIITAPSGAGKTTIVRHLICMGEFRLDFSVSACTRPMRNGEIDGKDYHFMSVGEFKSLIDDGAFIEWEEVYKNSYYGTLKSEVEQIHGQNRNVLFDVDVLGAINLKEKYGDLALAIFVMPPSIAVLKERLEKRSTDSEEKIKSRINKATHEIKFAKKFDVIVINDDLRNTLTETENLVAEFLKRNS
jgi:guanylate kinase